VDFTHWRWTCARCGGTHTGAPDIAYDRPSLLGWGDDPEVLFVDHSPESCIIEAGGRRIHYIRGVLLLPVRFAPGESFGFGVWSTLSDASFERYQRAYQAGTHATLEPMFGYLGNRIDGYPDTLNLHLNLLPQEGRARPHLRVQGRHADHPLFRDQAEGVDEARLTEILGNAMPCRNAA